MMPENVIVVSGPAGSGKTARMLGRYRRELARSLPDVTLWLAPTWRSATDVRNRLLDETLSACFSPAVMTFDEFAESVMKTSARPGRFLSGLMKRQLIRRLIDDEFTSGRLHHFRSIAKTSGLVELVSEWIREMKRLDIWPDRFRQVCEARGSIDKDIELFAIYDAYQRCLNDQNLYDTEGRFWSARSLLQSGKHHTFRRLQTVVVDGFADFTPPQHEIFEILATQVETLSITLPMEQDDQRVDLFSKSRGTLEELRRRHPDLKHEPIERQPDASHWPALTHLETNLFLNPRFGSDAPNTDRVEILAASHQLGEIERIGLRIKQLLTIGNGSTSNDPVRPSDIVVVFRSLSGSDDLIREVFGRLGLPFHIESGQTLDRSTALVALVMLLRLDIEDWPFRNLLAVLTNSRFRPDWPSWDNGRAVIEAERFIRRFQTPHGRSALLEQLAKQANHSGSWTFDSSAHRAYDLLSQLAEQFDKLPRHATLARWSEAWKQLAESVGLFRDEAREDSTDFSPFSGLPDHQAWRRLEEALTASVRLDSWLGRSAPELSRHEAFDVLLDMMRSVQVSSSSDESGCVRVLSAPSIRALRVPHLFFAGLAEQSFPMPERHDRLFSESEHQELIDQGLPLIARTERNREEMLLFYEVMTRASKRLYFSYPALDESALPLSPSPYLEEAEQSCGSTKILRHEAADLSPVPLEDEPFSPVDFRVKAVATAMHGNISLLAGLLRWQAERAMGENILAALHLVHQRQDRHRFGPSEGILTTPTVAERFHSRFGPDKTLGATDLEFYASCPFRFFAKRVLRLGIVEELGLDTDYLARGRLVHEILTTLHERLNGKQGEPSSPSMLDESDYNRWIQEITDKAFAQQSGSSVQRALGEVDRRLWLDWATDYHDQHKHYDSLWATCQSPLRPSWFEVSFGRSDSDEPLSTDRPLVLDADGTKVRIAGRIDRIDIGTVAGQQVFNIIDYKTGMSAKFTPEGLSTGTALQLPLYAMAVERLLLADRQAVAWHAGYWMIQNRGFKERQGLKMADCPNERVEPTAEWLDLQAILLETVGALARGIRTGRFPVSSRDEHCTRYCTYRTICRINHVRSMEKEWSPTDEKD